MNCRRSFLVLVVVAVFTGCPVTSVPPSQPSSQPLSQPVVESVVGNYSHAASKMTFPTELAGFSRAQIVRYDSAGLDVGVGYNLVEPSCGAAVTVYVSPAPRHTYVMADPAVVESTQASYLHQYFEATRPRSRNIIRALGYYQKVRSYYGTPKSAPASRRSSRLPIPLRLFASLFSLNFTCSSWTGRGS